MSSLEPSPDSPPDHHISFIGGVDVQMADPDRSSTDSCAHVAAPMVAGAHVAAPMVPESGMVASIFNWGAHYLVCSILHRLQT